ncbi:hypothetical protein FUAX_36800 [Fulvitalea axinellae]|uniref:Phage protein n=1 Tax=Fulvitalea axinellae TaxID=1182444 RepID=A0AAU9CM12_9BACT|nr:hypothetical protein FUAX_36800 [Fulvitalea axinellae]
MSNQKARPHLSLGGQELIQISKLPMKQIPNLIDWLPDTRFVSITMNGTSYHDFIEYSEYEFWYDVYFDYEHMAGYGPSDEF